MRIDRGYHLAIHMDGVTYFVHSNHLGSTAFVTNNLGDAVQRVATSRVL